MTCKLVFTNGETKSVDYNTAARIHQVMTGNKPPKDRKQAAYVAKISQVIFPNKLPRKRTDFRFDHGKQTLLDLEPETADQQG